MAFSTSSSSRRRGGRPIGGHRPTFANAFRGAHEKVDFVDMESGSVYRALDPDAGVYAVQHARKPVHIKYAIDVVTDVAELLDASRWGGLEARAKELEDQGGVAPPLFLDTHEAVLLSVASREMVTVQVSSTVLTTPRGNVGWVIITV